MRQTLVSNLEGKALDWAVAKARNFVLCKDELLDGQLRQGWWIKSILEEQADWIPLISYSPSTSYVIGGPILESENISTVSSHRLRSRNKWFATTEAFALDTAIGETGPTLLIAAMRCLIGARHGRSVEVPEELI